MVESQIPVVLRDLHQADFAAAHRVISATFAGEVFAYGMFGESPLDRLVGMTGEYREWPWTSDAIVVGADVGGVLVAVGLATRPGACHLCNDFDDSTEPSATPATAHRTRVPAGVSPSAPRLGIAAAPATSHRWPLIRSSRDRALVVTSCRGCSTESGRPTLSAQCSNASRPARRSMDTSGFVRVVEFDDPGGPGLRSVWMPASILAEQLRSAEVSG